MCRRTKKEPHPHFNFKTPYSKRIWMDTTKLIRALSLWERVKLGNMKRKFLSVYVVCILIRRIN